MDHELKQQLLTQESGKRWKQPVTDPGYHSTGIRAAGRSLCAGYRLLEDRRASGWNGPKVRVRIRDEYYYQNAQPD